jgi:ABC-type glycerol-3-phosphate transport system permease component
LAKATILVFVFSWNEDMLALTFLNADDARTVSVRANFNKPTPLGIVYLLRLTKFVIEIAAERETGPITAFIHKVDLA